MAGYPDRLNYYKPIHFETQELVPAAIYAARGEKSLELMDSRILYSLDCIREFLDIPLTVNDYLWGGKNHYRGYRPQGCSVGTPLSQHRASRAVDFVSKKMTGEEMRLKIMQKNRLFPFITRMENGTPHVHIDCANCDHHGIYLFNP